jgi:formate hydrogenlyase subunit 3/multisubunit Na+/H+ antiporter MnhD subunit
LAIATIAIGNLGVYAATSLRLIAANIVIVSVGTLLLDIVIGGGYSLSIGLPPCPVLVATFCAWNRHAGLQNNQLIQTK